MARIRTIKPEFWTDEKIGRLKRDERLLFIGIWNLADDQGIVKGNPAFIKGQLFSYDDDLRNGTIELWLASLQQARMIIPFTFEGESYYRIRTFNEHQLINRPSRSKIPDEIIDSLNIHGVLTEDSQPEGKGTGKGTGNREQGTDSLIFPFDSDDFKKNWDRWKKFKKDQFRFTFKSADSEQAQLHKLQKISAGDEKTAIAIIAESIAQGWQGLFELKKQSQKNGKTLGNNTPERTITKLAREILSGDQSTHG